MKHAACWKVICAVSETERSMGGGLAVRKTEGAIFRDYPQGSRVLPTASNLVGIARHDLGPALSILRSCHGRTHQPSPLVSRCISLN